jgi:hypothetical protein
MIDSMPVRDLQQRCCRFCRCAEVPEANGPRKGIGAEAYLQADRFWIIKIPAAVAAERSTNFPVFEQFYLF